MNKLRYLIAAAAVGAAIGTAVRADDSAPAGAPDRAMPSHGEAMTPNPNPKVKTEWFIDGYYEYNFNRPPHGVAGTNPQGENIYHVFDIRHNAPALNMAEVNFTQEAKPLGFRADFEIGPSSKIVNRHPSVFWRHTEQLYGTYAFGKSALDVGKFVTNAG